MIELRPMTEEDLACVDGWLRKAHVARWWPPETTVEAEVETYRGRVADDSPIRMLTVLERVPGHLSRIGWCQWYPYDGDPDSARETGAVPGECGIDYAIGDPAAIGRGLGTELISALVDEVHRHHPGCGIVVDPDAANLASRHVLEQCGFAFVELRPTAEGTGSGQTAIYRLAGRQPSAS